MAARPRQPVQASARSGCTRRRVCRSNTREPRPGPWSDARAGGVRALARRLHVPAHDVALTQQRVLLRRVVAARRTCRTLADRVSARPRLTGPGGRVVPRLGAAALARRLVKRRRARALSRRLSVAPHIAFRSAYRRASTVPISSPVYRRVSLVAYH